METLGRPTQLVVERVYPGKDGEREGEKVNRRDIIFGEGRKDGGRKGRSNTITQCFF